jgi:hypothetical protein
MKGTGMIKYELLQQMAKAGFTFGKDTSHTPYLVHEELYELLNKWTACLWGDRLNYKLYDSGPHGYMTLSIDGFEDQHRIWFEDDDLDLDRIITGVIHMYTWIP